MSAVGLSTTVYPNQVAIVKDAYTHITSRVLSIRDYDQYTVFTLYNKERKIAVLGHAGEYTSVEDSMDELSEMLRTQHQTPMNGSGFTAKVMGGTYTFATSQREKLESIFKKVNIPVESVPFDTTKNSPEAALNTRNGDLIFTNETFRFIHLLRGDQKQDYQNQIIHDLANKRPKPDMRRDEIIKEIEQALSEVAEAPEVKALCITTETLKYSSRERLFDKLLRTCAEWPSLINVMKCLLRHRFVLGIDINSTNIYTYPKETALDIATKKQNQAAIDLLKTYI